MPKVIYQKEKVLIKKIMFHKTAEELRELDKENDIKLLKLWKYLRKRNNKKIQKETMIKCQK